jgi:uncharacterized protein (DUF2141 family)
MKPIPSARAALSASLCRLVPAGPAPAAAAEVVVRVSGVAASSGGIGGALVPAGTRAVSVPHDLIGNRKVDTERFGIPDEARGVSNNVRPALRAPRFDEASFEVAEGQAVALDAKVAQ